MVKKGRFCTLFREALPVVLVVVLGLALLAAFFCGIGPRCNDRAAEGLLEKLAAEVELPPEAEIVETAAWVGNRSGTGDHVELWAGILIRYDRPEETSPETAAEILRDGWSDRLFVQPSDVEKTGPSLAALQDWEGWDYEQFPRTADMEEVFPALMGLESWTGYYILGVYGDAVTRWDIRGC